MTLGVLPTASAEEIKQAYRKLALKFHPDKHQNDDIAKVRFQKINEAYQELIAAKSLDFVQTETVTEIPTLTDDVLPSRELKVAPSPVQPAAPFAVGANQATPPPNGFAGTATASPAPANKFSELTQVVAIVLISFFAGTFIQSARTQPVIKEVVRFENPKRLDPGPRSPANLPEESELVAMKDEDLALRFLCKNAKIQNGLMKISATPPFPVMTLSQARPKAKSDAEAESVVALSARLRAQQLKTNHEAAAASRQIDAFCTAYQ